MPLSLAHLSFIRPIVMASMESGSTSANCPTVAATKEVLACFGEHKRVLKFSSGSPAQEISSLKQAFLITFSDVLENGVEEKNLVVQLKNELWCDQFLDVTDDQIISDRSVVNVALSSPSDSVSQIVHNLYVLATF